jgi:pimeloyl-[acyl-carrier protein] methyl ester esterase
MPNDPVVRTLVLLPGMDGTGELFTPFIEALPSSYNAVPVALPREKKLHYPEYVSLVCSLLPAVEPFILVAESFSSPIAIAVAARKPQNLQALVLCAGFALSPVQAWIRPLLRLLGPACFRLHLPRFLIRCALVGRTAPDPLVNKVENAISAVLPEVLHSRLEITAGCDVRAELAQIRVPILYLQAEQDRIVPSRCLKEIRRIKSAIAVATIEGPHLLLQTKPQQAVETIVKFINWQGISI